MTTINSDELVERVANELFVKPDASTIEAVRAALEASGVLGMRQALELALANVECLEGDKCPHWVEWHHVARKALGAQ